MYYLITPQLTEIDAAQADLSALTVGYIERDELADALTRFGFTDTSADDCVNERDNYRNAVEVYDNYTFGMVNIVDVKNVYAPSDRLAFFLRKNLLLVVSLRDEDDSTRQAFLSALKRYKPGVLTMEKLIFTFLESTIRQDNVELDILEQHITQLENIVAETRPDQKLSGAIYALKKKLLILRSYYEQVIDIGEGLAENENNIFEAENLHYFNLLTQKAERLSSTVSVLCDELNQLRDAYQSAMDYHLNATMKMLSVITIVCLPLTLVVGWYGMNFDNMFLPNTTIGYPLVIAACVMLVGLVLTIFKRKGML